MVEEAYTVDLGGMIMSEFDIEYVDEEGKECDPYVITVEFSIYKNHMVLADRVQAELLANATGGCVVLVKKNISLTKI